MRSTASVGSEGTVKITDNIEIMGNRSAVHEHDIIGCTEGGNKSRFSGVLKAIVVCNKTMRLQPQVLTKRVSKTEHTTTLLFYSSIILPNVLEKWKWKIADRSTSRNRNDEIRIWIPTRAYQMDHCVYIRLHMEPKL